MRFCLSFILGLDILYGLLIRTSLAQNLSSPTIIVLEPTSAPETTSEAPHPEPTQLATTTFFLTSEDTQTPFATTIGSAAPPSGGGASCVQDCLAKAASGAGCSSSADVQCICSSSTYLGLAQNCFGTSGCDASGVARALNDQNMLCRGAATTPAGQGPPTQPAPTPARTDFSGPDPTPPNPVAPSVNPSSASVSPRAAPTTLVFSSGAVLTVSGMQTTLTAGLTTLTQPAGATRTLPSASSGPGGEASNDAARRSRDMMPMLVAAGLVAYAWL